MPRWVETTTRVRWHEVDSQGVVYYGNYLHWCDLGREALAEAIGLEYTAVEVMTVEFRLRYRRPARYGDEVLIRTTMDWPRAARFVFRYEIYRKLGRELLAEGYSVHILLTRHGLRLGLDPYLHDKFVAFLGTPRGAEQTT